MVLCFLYFFVLNIFWVVFHTLFIVFFRLSYVFRFGTAHHLHPHLLTASLAQSNTVASTAFFLSSAFVFWSFGVDDTSSSFLLYHRSKGQKIRQHQPSASCVTQLTDYISNIRILPSSHRLSYQSLPPLQGEMHPINQTSKSWLIPVFAGRVLEILKIEVPFLFLNLYLIKKLHIQGA
uniref:Uncharacterized protein n=1 Tax=Lactuca sativa TaxID=4236 RepID=A0A9R1V238_LACSA|nr:hypothetical protein LSAT_V11C700344420 [Lactuca sativa]